MRRKARMRLIIFLLTITLGTLALSQANSENASVASIRQTPPTGTYFDHLVFIIMENAGMSNICGSGNNPPPCNGPDNPYMSGLANSYGLATRYVDLQGTSQPNYIGIMAATLNGCTSSCGPNTLSETNLVDRFEAAGLSWKAYMEDQTSVAGCDNSDHGFYEIAHNPFVAFSSIDSNASRCNKIALANPANNSTCTGTDCALVKDLNSGSAPNFMWVTPNDCNNAHGATGCANGCLSSYTSPCEKAGDNYLSGLVPNILNSNTFKNTRAALFITFDEGSGFCPLNGSNEDCMYTVWAGPVAKTNLFSSSTLRTHYAFTKTIETNWNLPTMTSNDAGATAMTEFFITQAPDFTITASPASLMFPSGNSSNSTITVHSIGGFAGTVTLTKTSSPTGLTLTLVPTSITLTSGGTITSTLTTSSSQIGNYTATVTGTSGTRIHNTNVTVQVTPPPNFAISANPSSLTLTHSVSGVASPVTVNSTGDPTVFESSYVANSFYAKGLIWLFYEDSANTCEHQAGCLTYTTSLNGSRWAPPTTVPVHITDSDFSVATNGTSIFYARYNETSFVNDCGRKLQFGLGSLSNTGTVTWQPEKTVTAGASNRVYVNEEIIVDSNGQVWIAYMIDNHGACGGNSTDLPFVIHSAGTNYSVWTGNFTLSAATSGNWHIALASLGNGQLYASYWCCNSDVHGRLYNNGWQADEQISTTATRSDVNGWLFNSGTNVYMIYFDDSTETFCFAARSSTGTWTVSTIGIGESHTRFPGYYSLSDAASYDVANNQFHLFYMNSTTSKIDEWTGAGITWNKTTGVVSTGQVPYPDSITSFIQSNPVQIGGVFYTSGSGSPFTIRFAALTFASTSFTGTFTVTVTSQNGFTGTVTLSTTTTPSTGLTVNCSITTISGGSGSSLCNLISTTTGSYNVNVTGLSGSLSHSVNVAVTVPTAPDFSISATSPTLTNVGQSPTSTITVTALNGFTGSVSLTDTPPSGLTCGAISPSSVTNSGTATVSCSATIAGNYTLTLTGTSGSLSHSATALFQFRDFNVSASSPVPVSAGGSATSTITVTAINRFNSVVTLTDTVPSGLVCGTINPSSVTGSGTATISCSATISGNYTLTITGASASLIRTTTVMFQVRDFTISANSPSPVNAATSTSLTITITALNHFAGTVNLTSSVPSGLTCGAITPSSVIGSGTATVSCTANVAGNYTLTITGTSGPLVHTATALFQFRDFAIGVTSVTVNAGSSGTATITVTAVNRFAGVVTLTDTVPSGLTCGAISPTSITGSGTAIVACNASIAGNYTLTVTATSSSLVHPAPALFQFRDFTISATTPATVYATQSANSSITITPLNHFNGSVNLSHTVPSGLTCAAITPVSLSGSGTATVSCTASIAGNYSLTLTGSSGGLSHSTTVVLRFQDFTITATSPPAVNAGQSPTSTVTIAAVNGFAGTVTFSITASLGLSCGSFSPTSVTGPGSASVSCTATVSGNYTATITGASTPLIHNATAVFQFRDFTIASTSPAPINVGRNATSTITVTAVNHFAGSVGLTDTVPSGLACGSITPNTFTGSGTATVSCAANVAGNYTLAIIGTSGTLVHSAIATFRFQNFTISASSPALVNAGQSATSSIAITSANGFAGVVTLTDTIPSGLSCGTITPGTVTGSGTATVSCISTVAGTYNLTVTGTAGTLIHSAAATFNFANFTIAASSPAPLNAGSPTTSTITIAAVNGFAGTVALSDSLPTGLTCGTINPTSLTGSGTATVSCSAIVAGNYTLTLTGTSGSLVHSATAIFQFRDFNLTATLPASANVGGSTTSTLTVTALNHFSGTVSLTDTLPPGLSCTAIGPSSVTGSGAATVSCGATIVGNYTLTLTGTSGSLVHTTTTLFQFWDFNTSSSSPSPVNTGTSAISTITITSTNHFNGTVNLTDSAPSGLACGAINPSSLAGSGTATVSCSATVAGNYTLTVTGTSGLLIHTATAQFQFKDFNITASSPSAAKVGVSITSNISVTSLNHFTGIVSLTDTVPSGLNCGTISPTSLPGSGTAMVSCRTTTAGNYTLSIMGASGSLSHSATVIFRFQDFNLTATSPVPVNVSQLATSILTVTAINGFAGTVAFSLTASPGLSCGSISPTSVAGTGSATLTCNATTAGNYTATITGTSAPIVHNATATLQFRDFTISIALPGPVNAGASANSTITLTALNRFAGVVSLADTVPPGLNCGNITPSSVTGSGTALVSCSSNVAGNYTLTVTGTNNALIHTANVTISIQDYQINSSPASVKTNAGSTGTSVITITPLNHFSGTVSLSTSSTAGVTSTINPMSITGGAGSATLTFSASSAGNYTVTVNSSSGTLTHTATVNVQIVDFTLTANPVAISILAGAAGNSTITVTGVNGFGGTVNLALTPSIGLSATITSTSIAASGSSTLSAHAPTAGNYSVLITATSGSLSHSISILIHVQDYGFVGSQVSIAAPIGSSTSSTLTIQSLNRYGGNLTLSDTVQPPGTTTVGGGIGGGGRTLVLAPPAVLLPSVSINPQSFQLLPGGTQQSILSITLPSNLPPGNYLIMVNATDGRLVRQLVITLLATDFSLTSTPNSATMSPGSNSTIVLNLQSLNFFQGNVTLTITSQAGGPNGTLTRSTVQLNFYSNVNINLTIQTPANTALGNYTITVQGTSGTVSHILSIAVRVSPTGFAAILAELLGPQSRASIGAITFFTLLAVFATLKIRPYSQGASRLYRRRGNENHGFRRLSHARAISCPSGVPILWNSISSDEF